MKPRLISATLLVWFAAGFALLAPNTGCLKAAEISSKFEVQLIWGTNDSRSPDPKHKPVEAEILAKLKELPLKWSNYFEVNRKRFVVPPSEVRTEALSKKCALEVKNLGGARVEVCLFGKGEKVVTRIQDLPQGDLLAIAGNAPNATSWMVVLKRMP
jgi:hypothetical protein